MTVQPRAVDVHKYYRTQGIDGPRMAANFDVVGIRAGQGFEVDLLLAEHVDLCKY